MNENEFSSPDPLAGDDSVMKPAAKRGPVKAPRVRPMQKSSPIKQSSPTKQTFELDVGNEISPQKIRVTVEAGSENARIQRADRGFSSPSPSRRPVNRRGERTTTTTIPLAGLSDTENEVEPGGATPKRGRGRPRKAGTPVGGKGKGRAGTPVNGKSLSKRKSIGDLVDGDDSADNDFRIGNGVEIGRGKGRSRSRSKKGISRRSTPAASDKVASSVTSKRGRRKSLAPEEVVVLQDQTGLEDHMGSGQGVEDGIDALASIDPNASYPVCEHQDEERSVYPSPNVAGTPSIPNSGRRSDKYPLPERSQFAEESIATSHYPSPEKSQDGQADEDLVPDQEEGYYENEGGDADEEPQEFDTILESEGFSMISMDSVPSLRKHLSSPAFQERETPRETLQKRALTNSRNEAKSQGNSFSGTPAEGERSTKNQRSLLSVQRAQTDDSFSSVPPEVLEAATPGVKSHVSRLISTKHSRMEDSFSSIAPEILQAATPAKPLQSMPPTKETHDIQTYEDSFSAIPSTVLNEATPAPVRKTMFKTSSRPSSAKSSTNPPSASSAPETAMHLQPPRLPTPEDTPSPDEEMPNESLSTSDDKVSTSKPISQGMSNDIDVDESSVFPSQMKSSPPSLAPRRYKYGNDLQQQSLYPDLSHLTATPSIQFSSPSLPPPVHVHKGPDARNLAPLQLDRPALSPIARSGRALQDLIVPSSPRNRSSSLGSPFKSPLQERRSSTVSRDLQNEIDSRQESRGKPLPKLDLQGNLFPHLSSDFQARRQSGSSTQTQESSQSSRWTKSRQEEDPFSNVRTQARSPSPEEKHGYSLEVPSQPDQRRRSDPSILNTAYGDNSVLSEDAMSWQADLNTSAGPNDATIRSSVHRRNPGESNQSWEDRWAAERAAVSRQIESASTSQVIVLGSDDSQVSPTSRLNEDEDDGECYDLLLETINSSSPSIEQRQIEQQMYDNVEKPRRSKLPSPWRKNSKRLVYSDEISHFSSPFVGANALTRRGKESSAEPTTVRRSSPEEVPARPISQKSNFAPRVRSNGSADLSALLGSPVKELPVLSSSSQESSLPVEKQPDSLSSRRQSGPSPGSMASERAKVDTATSSTQSFQPIQQKLGFRPRVRSNGTQDLSALLNSPIKGLPVLEQASPERNISPSMQGSSDSITESDVLGPSTSSDKEVSSGSSGLPYSSPTPFVPVPQKAGFTPRVRESRTSGISEKLLSSPVKPTTSSVANNNPKENITALGVVSSSRINSSQVANCASSQVFLSTHGEDSYDAGGKVDQLYMDHPRGTDENTCMVAPQYKNLSPTKSILRSPVKPTFGEESAAKTVGWVSSSPSPSEEATPLSPTTWSREHWDLLERIIDAWRPDGWSRDPTCPKLPSSTPNRRRSFNQTSVVSQLLGRVVSSQGEKMRLEQWHLEAVDEWREEVPGWEEGAICIRLLSLILGAERKINGTYGLRREMRARGENPDDPKAWAAAIAEVQARRASGM